MSILEESVNLGSNKFMNTTQPLYSVIFCNMGLILTQLNFRVPMGSKKRGKWLKKCIYCKGHGI